MKVLKTYGQYEVVEEERRKYLDLFYVHSLNTGKYYGGWHTIATAKKYAKIMSETTEIY
jgi:hypothetical protein